VQPAGGAGAGLDEQGARGSTVWGAKLGSEGLPRRGKRVKGQSRGTAWRVILQASPVTLPSARAMSRVGLSEGLEINDLCSWGSCHCSPLSLSAGSAQSESSTPHPLLATETALCRPPSARAAPAPAVKAN
jgi:hypothetical protein